MSYKKGDVVKFLGYSPEEITPNPPSFEPGDILEVLQVGSVVSVEELIVTRLSDGFRDVVWPEEVVAS